MLLHFFGTEGIKRGEGASNDTNFGPLFKKESSETGEKVFSICTQDQVVYPSLFFLMLIYKFKVISIKCLKEFYVHLHRPTKYMWRRKELKIIERIKKKKQDENLTYQKSEVTIKK